MVPLDPLALSRLNDWTDNRKLCSSEEDATDPEQKETATPTVNQDRTLGKEKKMTPNGLILGGHFWLTFGSNIDSNLSEMPVPLGLVIIV